jgi:hypothetical protein
MPSAAGPKFGGGVDTASFCGRVDPKKGGGWDLEVRITLHHLTHACRKCVPKYREALYERAYGILIELAGADPTFKADFVRFFVEKPESGIEWRFQGRFGSGGKFHRVQRGLHEVTCYPEDLGKVGGLLKTVNERLALEFPPGGV